MGVLIIHRGHFSGGAELLRRKGSAFNFTSSHEFYCGTSWKGQSYDSVTAVPGGKVATGQSAL